MAINFHQLHSTFRLFQKLHVKDWIKNAIAKEGFQPGSINIIFCDDDYLFHLNKKYLSHNTFTDIITFDYSEQNRISGDLFISIDRVNENAQKFKVSFNEELMRVVIHGILHMCGYKDKTTSDKLIMREKEENYLSLRTF